MELFALCVADETIVVLFLHAFVPTLGAPGHCLCCLRAGFVQALLQANRGCAAGGH